MNYWEQLSNRVCKAEGCNNFLKNRHKYYCSKKCSSTDEGRRKACSEHLKRKWKDEEYKTRRRERSKIGNAIKWQDPEYRAKMIEISRQNMKRNFDNPDFLERHQKRNTAMLKKRWKNPEFRKKIIEINKNQKHYSHWNALKAYRKNNTKQCYLYIILFNNKTEKFFKVGVARQKYRPTKIAKEANVFTTKIKLIAYDDVEKLCTIEHNIHFKLGLKKYKQDYVVNGKTEIYHIKDLRTVAEYIKRCYSY